MYSIVILRCFCNAFSQKVQGKCNIKALATLETARAKQIIFREFSLGEFSLREFSLGEFSPQFDLRTNRIHEERLAVFRTDQIHR